MKIDEKVLEAVARALAPRTWDVLDTVKEGSPIEREIAPQIRKSVEDARTAIEAYEAARWRPICEVPITPNEPVYPIYVEMFNGHHVGIGYAQESYDDENVLEFWSETGEPIEPKPIMFRTIDPPSEP